MLSLSGHTHTHTHTHTHSHTLTLSLSFTHTHTTHNTHTHTDRHTLLHSLTCLVDEGQRGPEAAVGQRASVVRWSTRTPVIRQHGGRALATTQHPLQHKHTSLMPIKPRYAFYMACIPYRTKCIVSRRRVCRSRTSGAADIILGCLLIIPRYYLWNADGRSRRIRHSLIFSNLIVSDMSTPPPTLRGTADFTFISPSRSAPSTSPRTTRES